MKKIIFYFTFALLVFNKSASAQKKDSVESLFGNLKYSYTQFDIGYTGMVFQNRTMNGFHFNFGGVLNNKVGIGFGIEDVYAPYIHLKNYLYTNNLQLEYTQMPLTIEFLFKPNKLLNFSIPLKFSWAMATLNAMNSNNGYGHYATISTDNFFVAEPGAKVFLNLFRGMSIGVGASYRIAFGTSVIANETDFRNYSFCGLLRFKMLYAGWQQRQIEKNKQLMKSMYGTQQ